MRYAQEFSPSAHRNEKKHRKGAFSVWRRRRDTAASGRLLAACYGGSRTLGCNTRLVRRTNFCAYAQKCSHPSRTAKKKSRLLPALFLWRRRRDTAASGRLLAACYGESRTLGCNTRLVRRTTCATRKCSHPPHTATRKSTAKVLFSFWRRRRDSNPRGLAPKRFSRPPRCDRFDTPPKRDCIITNGAGRVKRLSMREGEKTGGGRGKARGKTGQSGCVRGRRKRVKTCVNASCGIGQKRARSRSREMSKRAGHGARKMSKHAGS